MSVKLVLLAACLALAHAALVKRDAPPPLLEELQKHAADFQKTFTESFAAIANSEQTAEIQKSLKEGSDSVINQLSTFSNSLQGVISDATGKSKEALEQTKASLERTIGDLRQAHPEVEQQAGALQAKFRDAVQKALQDSQELAKKVGDNMEETNTKLAPKIKEAYDTLTKHLEEVQKKIHEAATKQ